MPGSADAETGKTKAATVVPIVVNVARRIAAATCLFASYEAAITKMAPAWVALSMVAAAVIAVPSHWLPAERAHGRLEWVGMRRLTWTLLPGWVLLAVAAGWKLASFPPRFMLWTWLAGAAWVLIGAHRLRQPPQTPSPPGARRAVWIWGLAILAFAGTVRLYGIDRYPHDVHSDEGMVVLLGLEFYADPARDWLGVRDLGSYSMMNICYGLASIGAQIGGFNLAAARLPDTLLGIASVVLIFDALRRVSTLPLAIAGALLVAANHCHIGFSRIASSYIQTAFAVSLVFWILARVWRAPTYLNAALLGLTVAVGVQTYQASMLIAPLFWASFAALLVLNPDRRRALAPALLVSFVTWAAASVPLGTVFWFKGGMMAIRAREVNIFTPAKMAQLMTTVYHTDSKMAVVANQAWNSLQGFYVPMNTQPQYGSNTYGMADPYSAALMVPGVIMAVAYPRRFLTINAVGFTLGFMLFGLGLQWGPGFNRTTGALPLGMVFPAVAAVQCCAVLWGSGRIGRRLFEVSLAAIVIGCAAFNLWIYFVHNGRIRVWGDPVVEAGWVARRYVADYEVYLASWNLPPNEGQRLILGSLSDAMRARVHLMPPNTQTEKYMETVAPTGAALFVTDHNEEKAGVAVAARFPNARREIWQPAPPGGTTLDLLFVEPGTPAPTAPTS